MSIMICMFKVTHHYLQIYLKTFEINVLKYLSLIQLIFIQDQKILKLTKKTKIELELSADINMLLIAEKGVSNIIY